MNNTVSASTEDVCKNTVKDLDELSYQLRDLSKNDLKFMTGKVVKLLTDVNAALGGINAIIGKIDKETHMVNNDSSVLYSIIIKYLEGEHVKHSLMVLLNHFELSSISPRRDTYDYENDTGEAPLKKLVKRDTNNSLKIDKLSTLVSDLGILNTVKILSLLTALHKA